MSRALSVRGVDIVMSTASDGDFHLLNVPADELERRQRSLIDADWVLADQRHTADVVRITDQPVRATPVADVLVSDRYDVALAVWVADCAPVVVISDSGDIAVAHAGWRGIAAGALDAAFDAVGGGPRDVVLGPTIGPCCYEFGADDLAGIADAVDLDVSDMAAETTTGSIALDVPATVAALASRRSATFRSVGGCTGCAFPGFSHRVRRDPQRHVVAAIRRAAA